MPRMPRLVGYSVALYRFLLAAYPAAFRNEYGEAMVQLFRDTAREAYRRGGSLSLVAVWLQTLADFTISVLRQHRDKPLDGSSESVLLGDFLHKWQRLGSDALCVSAFSAWYGLHLLRLYFQRATLVWVTLTAIAFGIWSASLFDRLNWMRARGTRIDILWGLVQIEHCYDMGEPISYEQELRDLRAWWERNPGLAERVSAPGWPWEFSFFADLPGGSFVHVTQWRTTAPDRFGSVRREPVLVEPYKSWRLRFPFGIVPALLLGGTIRVYRRRKPGPAAAMQSA